jgi:carbamoyltransferase
MKNISFYFQHDASISVECDGSYYVFELERITRKRYFNLLNSSIEEAIDVIKFCFEIIKKELNITNNFDICVFPGHSLRSQRLVLPLINKIKKIINANQYIVVDHHLSHAACCAYQSPYNEGIVVSFDGAGNDGKFNIYNFNQKIKNIKRLDVESFGKCYRQVSFIIKDIIKSNKGKRKHLVGYAGKLMGLVAYGKVKEEWVSAFENFYLTRDVSHLDKVTGLKHLTEEQFKNYVDNNIFFEEYEGQIAYDLAATNQFVFEKLFFKLVDPFIEANKPILLSGGCSLNVLLNEKVRLKYGNRVFIPPNPDDSGISLGQLFLVNPPKTQVDVTYSGLPILDLDNKQELLSSYNNTQFSIKEVASLLKEGNIIGVLRGNSEIGPRALGNRSILCDPSFTDMKNKLNKIKNREWFRPFASVIKYEDVRKYFNFDYESRFMSFSPTAKDHVIDKYPSIAHVDKTARVQTVKKEQNEFLYDLLNEMNGPLLNTSLNIDGEPMVSTIEQALNILKNTSLDYLIIQETLVKL